MAGNTLGTLFKVTTFGESHGVAIGAVIDGCPPNILLDLKAIQADLDRRKPGQSTITTQRKEEDEFQILSGVFDGKTTGAPIAILIPNADQRSKDYDALKDVYRPSHADYTYQAKYGIRDYKGGGRASARTTASIVAAGAIAKQLLAQHDIIIHGYVSQVGEVKLNKTYHELNLLNAETNIVRCPDDAVAEKMIQHIEEVRTEKDSIGGVVSCVIKGCEAGLGEPLYDKLEADLAKAMMNINATKGFEIGSGFAGASMRGSQHNDEFTNEGHIRTGTNNSGGVQGGISNGEDIYFNVAFKPTATIAQKQQTINTSGDKVDLEAKGRHDPCVVPRAVPIVEAMAALVIIDHLLRNKIYANK